MKVIGSWLSLGVMVTWLIHGPASLEAQPSNTPDPPQAAQPGPPQSDPLATDASDKPWSQGVSPENRKAARPLFLEGNRLFQIPLFKQAAEKYAAALVKWKHPAIYMNLALAQLNSDREAEAHDNLEHALEYGEEPLGAAQFQEARRQLEDLNYQLGRIRVTCRTRGALVTLDGVPLFTGPGSYEGWIKAKPHELTARKPDYLSEARRVTVTPGTLHTIDLKLITLSEANDASRRWAVWKPWAVVAAGGAVVAAGGVFHGLSFGKFKAYDDKVVEMLGRDCGNPNPRTGTSEGCSKDILEMKGLNATLGRAKQQQEIAVAGYIVGSSLVAAGVVLLYLNQPRLREQGVEVSATSGIAIIPAVSSDMLGMLVNISH